VHVVEGELTLAGTQSPEPGFQPVNTPGAIGVAVSV
jgi:hypothetical protein